MLRTNLSSAQVMPETSTVTGLANTFFVDQTLGDDDSPGTIADPWKTVAKVNAQTFVPGNEISFKRGESWSEDLVNTDLGTASERIIFKAYGAGVNPILRGIHIEGDNKIIEDIDVNCEQVNNGNRGVRVQNGINFTYRRSELQNGILDGLDIRNFDGVHLEDLHIHHFLRDSYTGQGSTNPDAHGIALRNVQFLTAAGKIEIHHVSGDSMQIDPNRDGSDNITFTDAGVDNEWWTSPLATTFNAGWVAGVVPGENAFDAKVQTGTRMSVAINNLTCHGWENGIANMAALNLKEGLDFTGDGFTCFDSNWACRFRKTTGANAGNPNVLLMNSVIYDISGAALRLEDGLDFLNLYNNTFGSGIAQFLDQAGGGLGVGEDLRNNAFLGIKPAIFSDSTNVSAVAGDFNDEPANDYRLLDTATNLVDQGATIPVVTQDRNGTARSAPYEVGAFEGFISTTENAFYEAMAARSDAHTAVAFRSQADVEAHWRPNNHDDVSYDPVEDALQIRWPTAGGGSNINDLQVNIAPTLDSGNVFVTWEGKWSVEWVADGSGTNINGFRQLKDYQYADSNQYSSGGLQLEVRRLCTETAPTEFDAPAGSSGGIDCRTYFGGGGGPGQPEKRLADTLADFVLGNQVWIRYFLFVEYGGNGKITLWVTQPGDAPTKIYDQQPGDSSGDPGAFRSFWFEHNSSQTYSGPTSYVWNKNLVVLDGVADLAEAQSLVTQGSAE